MTRVNHRRAFTLIELLLSLSLIVVATALVGSLMSLYARSFVSKTDQIKQKQLARSLLTMMADDIRGVVVAQEYDASVLSQMLGGGGAGGMSGGATDTASGTGTSPTSTAASSTSSTNSSTGTTTTTDTLLMSAMPPGIFGSRYQLMVDVSRIPRANEYQVMTGAVGMITDVPGDVKTVTYLLQTSNPMGVQDTLLQVAQSPASASPATQNSGLVRRALDRAVMAHAEETAMTNQLMNAGSLVAPEVVAMEFAYYDGTQWLYEWDSSTQGLPWLIQITLGLQSADLVDGLPSASGITLSTLSVADQERLGINIYELTVAIPGAKLQPLPSTESADSGMESVGL